jgi:hypothetical protein
MESHDEERVAYKCVTWGNGYDWYNVKDTSIALRRLEQNALFFFTIPGPKMIWQFGEMGYDYSIDFNGRLGIKPVRWDYLTDWKRKYLYDYYSALINLRTEHPVFETDDFTLYTSSALKKIVLRSEEADVVVLGNFDVIPGEFVPGFTHTGTWYEYFTGQTIEVTDLEAKIRLVEGEHRLYSDVMLPGPSINTGVKENQDEGRLMKVYPNPADEFTIEIENDKPSILQLEVFDLVGNKIDQLYNGQIPVGTHHYNWPAGNSTLPDGIYFLKMKSQYKTEVTRIILK